MDKFIIEFPESVETLFLFYALEENGFLSSVVRNKVDTKLIEVRPLQNPKDDIDIIIYHEKIKGFIMGWTACYYKEDLPKDVCLQPTPGAIGR
jgi:hypothetical protein